MPNRESTPSSGNVFADLNLPQADDLLAKAELAAKIIAEIQRRRLTQSHAAAILGIDQPKVSALKQGKLSGFSIERLMRLLLLLEETSKSLSKPSRDHGQRLGFVWPDSARQSQPVKEKTVAATSAFPKILRNTSVRN
jgi:predicted XRE-type DNA-binding protein